MPDFRFKHSVGVAASVLTPLKPAGHVPSAAIGCTSKICENAIQDLDLNALTQGPIYRLGWTAIALEAYVRHVLRLIREVLFFQPQHSGTCIREALRVLNRVLHRRAIVFLLSDDAAMISGVSFPIDGGYTSR